MAKKKPSHKLYTTLLSFLLHNKPPPRLIPHSSLHKYPPPMDNVVAKTLVIDVEGGLLRSPSLFPYFMLVALEAGGFLRGLVLLLLYPLLSLMGNAMALKAMAMVSFCGLRAKGFRAGRAVLPKWFLEDMGLEGFEVMKGGWKKVVCVSRMPRVMVEGFLEYLEVDVVVGREMRVFWGFYTGFMEEEKVKVMKMEEKEKGDDVVGFTSSSMDFLQDTFLSCCKEVYMVSQEEKSKWRQLPRHKYPKPLVFHDGRLAVAPTPLNALAMFTWLPFGVPLAVARLVVGVIVPYKYSTPLLSATGMSWRLRGAAPPPPERGGQLYVCNHRTLVDPAYVSIALDRPVRAVSYSLSRVSELVSPIGRPVRLTRDRAHDGLAMASHLARGEHVVVCAEGTTCREPYLLRFSPLFAELSSDVVPVALAVDTAMFYATTAGGSKCLDPYYYTANPRMCYEVQFLDRVDTSSVREGMAASTDMANLVQRRIGVALGYGCTMLTRKDKYLMLAGNDGTVNSPSSFQHGDKSCPSVKSTCMPS